MNTDELDKLANRAFVYIDEDEPERAVDFLIAASDKAFDFADTSKDALEKSKFIDLGNEYLSLAENISVENEEDSQKSLSMNEQVRKKGGKDWQFEIPTITFDDVIGMDNLKMEIINKLINPTRDQNKNSLANQYKLPKGFGLLLYGPTGTGKTFFARAVAGELGWPLYVISGSAIISKYVGESEKNLMHLFSQAKSHKRSVIFIDEIETIFPDRKTKELQQHEKKLAGELLAQLDGIDPAENWMLIIGATNNPTALDDALLRDGRLGIHAFVGLPEKKLIVEMLQKEMTGIKLQGEIDFDSIADKLVGLTLNSVKNIAEEVRSIAYIRDTDYYNRHPEMEQVALGVRSEDFDQAMKNRTPMRISEKSLVEMQAFQEQHLNHIIAERN